MIPAKEFEGESWISAADFHRQKKEWVGLTDDEIWGTGSRLPLSKEGIIDFVRALEAKLKEKNGG